MQEYGTKAREMDEQDALAGFRKAFGTVLDEVIYLDGNSLGPLPRKTLLMLDHKVREEWGQGMIRSWNKGWFDLPLRLGRKLAPLIGAGEDEVIFCDSVTVNFMKLVAAVIQRDPHRTRIVTDDLNFPSNFYALDGLLKGSGNGREVLYLESPDGIELPADLFRDAITQDTALVTVSHVAFKSGYLHDLEAICEIAHSKGALVLADLSHSVGALPIHLNEWGVDLAVGCSYKYLNGGPGAPAFVFVRKELLEELPQVLTGWMGCADPFGFSRTYSPAAGMRRFLVGTPPILSLQAIEPGLDLLLEAGLEPLRRKAVQLSEFLLEMYEDWLQPLGFTLGSPLSPERRGSHLSFRHPEAYRINKAMIEPRNGVPPVVPDFRKPDNLRLGMAPLYLRFHDIYRAVQRVVAIVESREFEYFSHDGPTVT